MASAQFKLGDIQGTDEEDLTLTARNSCGEEESEGKVHNDLANCMTYDAMIWPADVMTHTFFLKQAG